ncbi:hypothetical protein HDV06_005698 [Boothiomyces sp. JEL0866]|nr:hypothetical protein HDV06_005698 [Boothiomyces sp. JEL0866]
MSTTISGADKKMSTKNALEKTMKIYMDEEHKKKVSVVDRLSAPKTVSKPTSAYISRKTTVSSMAGASRPTSRNVANAAQDQIKYRDSRQRKYETTAEERKKSRLASSITAPPAAVADNSNSEQSQLDISKKEPPKESPKQSVGEKSSTAASNAKQEKPPLETLKRAQSPRLLQQTESQETTEKKPSRPKSALSHWESAETTQLTKDESLKVSKPTKQEAARSSVGNTLRPSSGTLQRPNSGSKQRPTSGSKRPTSPRKSPPPEEPKPEEIETRLQAEAANELIVSLQNRISRLEEQNAKLLKERDRLTRDLDNHIKANVGERTNVDHLKAQFTEQHAQNASLIVHNR